MLYGRSTEMQHIDKLLRDARAGRSGALVIVAESGEGKSALLRAASGRAGDGCRVMRCTGVESPCDVPFAGLRLLLGAAADRLDRLPGPQRHVLGAALGQWPAVGADRFLLGVAVVSLLADLTAEGPVLCLVDDVHRLDRPSVDALLFAARRLGAEGIAMLFAAEPGFDGHGLPELRPEPLEESAAAELLIRCRPGLDAVMRERVLRAAAGNPLALLEFDPSADAAQSARPGDTTRRLLSVYETRIAAMAETARATLLVAASADTSDRDSLLRVLHRLGHTGAALAEAESSRMVTLADGAITFAHPLQRRAAYHRAAPAERRAVHTAWAEELVDDPIRRAWHLAAAATGPDETLAAALETAAAQASDQGGHASAAAALERAAQLSPAPAERARRITRAVETAAEAGRTDYALRLADAAERTLLRPAERARVISARALIEFEYGSPKHAHQLMLAAAEHLADIAPERAAWLLIEAGRIAWTAGDLVDFRVAHHRLAELSLGPMRDALLSTLRGPLVMQTGDPVTGIAMIRANAVFGDSVPLEMISVRMALAAQLALIGDMPTARAQLTELAAVVCARGMVGWYPAVACFLANTQLILGDFREAEVVATQALRIAADIGQPSREAAAEALLAMIAAVRGEDARCRELTARTLRQSPDDGNAIDITHCHWALALLDLGHGRHQQALDRLRTLYERPKQARGHWVDLLADLVEAAARLGRPDRAVAAVAEIDTWAAALDLPWAEGLALRCRGLLTGEGELYAKAMTLHATADRWYDHARTALLYGEWLLREQRASEARAPLRRALETFDRLGAAPWADRARTGLRAAGERDVPEPEPDVFACLTPQERHVVRLAATGATDEDIAAQLFLSAKTVGHHVHRVLPKLGVADRDALARLFLD
ncbi:AAA family ATPase [Nocardia sp. NPDC050406]|uniref:AAA family ATPase n=1 Tax=Nocardia sp. NPDC050406 TaxID=3364318 RepID=UPI0037ADF757